MGYWINFMSPVEICPARNLICLPPLGWFLTRRPLAACILTLNDINFGNKSVMTLMTGDLVSVLCSCQGQVRCLLPNCVVVIDAFSPSPCLVMFSLLETAMLIDVPFSIWLICQQLQKAICQFLWISC